MNIMCILCDYILYEYYMNVKNGMRILLIIWILHGHYMNIIRIAYEYYTNICIKRMKWIINFRCYFMIKFPSIGRLVKSSPPPQGFPKGFKAGLEKGELSLKTMRINTEMNWSIANFLSSNIVNSCHVIYRMSCFFGIIFHNFFQKGL